MARWPVCEPVSDRQSESERPPEAREDAAPEDEFARTALDLVADGVVLADAGGLVLDLNAAAERICGWSRAAAKGRDAAEVLALVDESTRMRIADPVRAALRTGRRAELTGDVLLLNRHGHGELAVDVFANPIANAVGLPARVIVVVRDVTEQKGLSRLATFQATHDVLTGLVNRREFERRLQAALDATRRPESPAPGQHVFCHLDLDQFEVINDTGGHAAGDRLLRQVAEVLETLVRRSDSLARLDGDRFGVLLERCSLSRARRIVDEMRRAIQRLRFPWRDRVFEISACAGLVELRPESGDVADVLSAAAWACAAAKEHGPNRVRVYTRDDAGVMRQQNFGRWMEQVQRALEYGSFRLLVQEIRAIQPKTDAECHGELLVRMVDDAGALVAPHAFLAAAERFHLMPAIDRWVVRNALDALLRRPPALAALHSCSVNLSGQSLSTPDFLEFVCSELARVPIPPSCLGFEITETAVIADLASAQRFIGALKAMGCRFALDDFGTGLSSFGYLRDLPVDALKIDGSFVRGLADDPTDRAMVESINQIGHVLGLQTVAEYVENKRTLDLLRQIGVDYAQGSAISDPQPVG